MKVYLVVETKGAGEFEEKHLRVVSRNENMAYQAYNSLKYAKRGFNEPVSSYFIEETDLDEVIKMDNITTGTFRQYALILALIIYSENNPKVTKEELQKMMDIVTGTIDNTDDCKKFE